MRTYNTALVRLSNLEMSLNTYGGRIIKISDPFMHREYNDAPEELYVHVVGEWKKKTNMKYFIIGAILFAVAMVIFYFTGLIPEPATLGGKIIVVFVSVATLGLGLWEILIRGIFKK